MRLSSVLALLLLAPALRAQATLSASTELLAAPGGRVIADVRRGSRVTTLLTRGPVTKVSIAGFVSRSLAGGKRDSFAVSVKPGSPAQLRAAATTGAPVVATLRAGTGLSLVARRGEWIEVVRSGWIPTRLLASNPSPATTPRQVASVAPTRPAARAAPPASPVADTGRAPPVASGAMTPARATTLSTAPDGAGLATLSPGVSLRAVARDRGWVRVQVEGWVKESDLLPADSSVLGSLSGADIRADPEAARGRTVRWDVQVIARQSADPLRRDLAPDEPYLLARGPGKENSLVYLAIPPALLAVADGLPPLSRAIISARVRTGRSDPAGVPILDLLSIARR
ncbi:MAG: SH3 domain-containing protein [Gemmatimonadota bacterium]|nr:SH3 domain-containing protein [Gemmatimonadota bacterium]